MVNFIKDETLLFFGGYLEREIDETILRIREYIDDMSFDSFTELTDDEILDDLLYSFEFSAPEIYEEGIDIANNSEIKINVQSDTNRDIVDRNKPFYVPGHTYTFSIPCSGDKRFWYLRGSSGSMNHPRGTVRDNEILITIQTSDTDTTNVKKIFDDQIKAFRAFLPSIQQGVKTYNSNLPSVISNFIRQRRERLGKDDEGIKSLGIPIRRIPDVKSPFKIPKAKSKIRIEKRITRKSNTVAEKPDETFVSMEDFDSILSDIERMAKIIERSPSAFGDMDEESLRWIFMIPLNIQYDSTTGETFNYKGKTDILIRDQGNNIFIAECKIWRGLNFVLDKNKV